MRIVIRAGALFRNRSARDFDICFWSLYLPWNLHLHFIQTVCNKRIKFKYPLIYYIGYLPVGVGGAFSKSRPGASVKWLQDLKCDHWKRKLFLWFLSVFCCSLSRRRSSSRRCKLWSRKKNTLDIIVCYISTAQHRSTTKLMKNGCLYHYHYHYHRPIHSIAAGVLRYARLLDGWTLFSTSRNRSFSSWLVWRGVAWWWWWWFQ